MTTTTLQLQLTLVECCVCHLVFGVPRDWDAERLRKRDTWHCPNGHGQHYTGETETEKLRKRLRAEQARCTHLEDQALAAERSARAYKGQATRARKRAAAGVCPAPGCHRTFQDLARHMAGQHPGFQAEHAHPEPAP